MTSRETERRALLTVIKEAEAKLAALNRPEYVEPKYPGAVIVWCRTFPHSDKEYTYVAVRCTNGEWATTWQDLAGLPISWDELSSRWEAVPDDLWVKHPQGVLLTTPLSMAPLL